MFFYIFVLKINRTQQIFYYFVLTYYRHTYKIKAAKKTKTQRRRVRRKKQKGEFFNRYDFAYAGPDTVNQTFKNLDKSGPPLIKNLSGEVNKILEQRINQIIRQDGAELKQVATKLLKGAIKDAYKTLFRLLGNFGKKNMAEAKQKLKTQLSKFRK